ncbi:Polysaccharide biosynthesis protein [Marinobacterium sp. xm-a-121]|uniref:lipopolysaccharide biosynthesis protein n=1 Tax=unclassified Marinobacterium TaxID=2644139 RepID=UPI001569AC7F|nr:MULTISPECIES: oligosaccharide flippase family protein [unclassified Marinobacterium]NRP37533.1 Polysaccharide biosynthesis protein [Marinobacterium sp. xm-a-121]NRP99877.1 Polysaccharide biosynthesis protein [Marinobacterium sp. xm-v-233]
MTIKVRKNQFIFDILKQASGTLIAQMFAIVAIPVITRFYTPEQYGEYSIFVQILMGVSILLTLRLEHFIVLAESHATANTNLRTIMAIGGCILLLLVLVYLVGGDWILKFSPVSVDGMTVAVLLGIGLILSLNCGIEQTLQKRRMFFKSSVAEAVAKFSFLLLAVLLSMADFGINGIFAALCLGYLFKCCFLLFASNGDIFKGKISFSLKGLLPVRVRAITLVYSHFLLAFTQLIPFTFIMTNYGKEVMGQFSLAFSTLNLVATLGALSMSKVYFQRMSEIDRQVDKKALWNRTFAISLCIALPVYLLVFLLSGWAYGFIFGDSWEMAGKIATIMVVSSFFEFISRPMESTSLVLNVWWYTPIWHTLRTTSMVVLTQVVDPATLSFEYFLILYVAVMSMLFIFDLIVQKLLVLVSK